MLGINNFWISREIEGNQKSYLLFISRCVAIWPPDQTLLTANAKILVPLLVLLILSVGAAIALGVKLWKVNQHLQSKNASQKFAVEKNSENVHENCSEVGAEEEEILNTIVSQNSNWLLSTFLRISANVIRFE